MKHLNSIFPNLISLSKKDSNISTKRYGDLRLLNHTILQSWVILAILAYNKMWSDITTHFVILVLLCFGRGLLAKDNFLNDLIDGRRNNDRNDNQ